MLPGDARGGGEANVGASGSIGEGEPSAEPVDMDPPIELPGIGTPARSAARWGGRRAASDSASTNRRLRSESAAAPEPEPEPDGRRVPLDSEARRDLSMLVAAASRVRDTSGLFPRPDDGRRLMLPCLEGGPPRDEPSAGNGASGEGR